MSLLDSILDRQATGPRIVSENHDVNSINWVAGMTDPGEMIACGAYQELRRLNGENDTVYQQRLTTMLANMPADIRSRIMSVGRQAALQRASLDTSNGRVNMFAAGELPWHGLGVNVSEAVTSAHALSLAGMDWEAVKKAVSYQTQSLGLGNTEINQEWRTVPDMFALCRSDTGAYLGNVGSRYRPIQNREAFSFLDGVLEEFGAKYESAGSVHGGRKVWVLAQMPRQAFTINGGDEIKPYVLFTNPHDGSGRAWCFPTSVRVVCANTYVVASKDRHAGLGIRHTGNVGLKLNEARKLLGLTVNRFAEFKKGAEQLYHKPINAPVYFNNVLDQVLQVTQAEALKGADALTAAMDVTEAKQAIEHKRLTCEIERRKNVLDDILNRYEQERYSFGGAINGTAWKAFNAVTEHADHNTLGNKAKDKETRLSRRFENVMQGEANTMKQVAYAQALAMAV